MVLLSLEQIKEILAWFREPGPKLKDYDKPILYRLIGYWILALFSLTIITVDNVALGMTMRVIFVVSVLHVFGDFILSIKRSMENFKHRKALEEDGTTRS